MLSPVSPSATGNTFRSLTSCRRFSSSASADVDDPPEADQALVGHGHVVQPRAAGYTCLVTLPALRQRVQTYSRRGVPPTSMRTFCRFGLKRRLVATIEWLRLFPNAGPFLHE